MSTDAFPEALTITDSIARAWVAEGIVRPTPVQADAIPAALAGKHVVMHSGTGTGKTLAYLLPVLQRLREHEGRAAVIAPGVELAMQTLRVANAYKDADLSTAAAVSTTNSKRQRKRVQRSTRLVIGTTDRMIELFRTGKLKGTTLLVLDEIDPILSSRHSPFLDELLSRSEPRMQVLVATATLSSRSEAFLARFVPDAVRVNAPDAPLQSAIEHRVVRVPAKTGKEVVLARFIQQQHCSRAIVFASDSRHQAHLFHFLSEHGISTATVSRERSKQQRQQGLEGFRKGDIRVVIMSDATARGIDVPQVEWVLHYDVPRSAQAYVHRAGRTGRAGHTGTSVLFTDSGDHGTVRKLARQLGIEFMPFAKGDDPAPP